MDVTSAGTQAVTFQQRIDALRETKVEHTAIKLQRRGYFDIDDHGYIPWDEPIPFDAQAEPSLGGLLRCSLHRRELSRLAGGASRLHPPQSALAGAWVGYVPKVGGWRPEERAHPPAPLAPGIQHPVHRHRRHESLRPGHEDRPRPGLGRSAWTRCATTAT